MLYLIFFRKKTIQEIKNKVKNLLRFQIKNSSTFLQSQNDDKTERNGSGKGKKSSPLPKSGLQTIFLCLLLSALLLMFLFSEFNRLIVIMSFVIASKI